MLCLEELPLDEIQVPIRNRDFWVKVIEMLQQNWALIEDHPGKGSCTIYFINDGSGVFDQIDTSSKVVAVEGLLRNGFKRYADDLKIHDFIFPPILPFKRTRHPNGQIYSSGRYWV